MEKSMFMLKYKSIFIAISFLGLAGCTLGPKTLHHDRFEYNEAIARSSREQMLQNIVRIRYMESPVFMSVSSLVNQYSIEGEIAGSARWGWGSAMTGGTGNTLGGASRFANRPTVTYSPMVGAKFSQSILTPIKPQAVLSMIESGWQVQTILPLMVQSLNGIQNRFYVGNRKQKLDTRFVDIVNLMAKIQASGTLSIRAIQPKEDNQPTFVMMISNSHIPEEQSNIKKMKELMGLDPDAEQYKVVFGQVPADGTEIAIVTRSFLSILADMSSYVEVPEEDITDGRTAAGAPMDDGLKYPIIVHSSKKAPTDAHSQIYHRNRWFWIDDRDMSSKRLFTILQLISMLAESPDTAQTPLVTIPAGG